MEEEQRGGSGGGRRGGASSSKLRDAGVGGENERIKSPLDGKPLAMPLMMVFICDLFLRFAVLAVLLPVLWPLHVVMKTLNNSKGGRWNVAFTPVEACNVAIGKWICYGLGVRVARVGTENFVDERGSSVNVRTNSSSFFILLLLLLLLLRIPQQQQQQHYWYVTTKLFHRSLTQSRCVFPRHVMHAHPYPGLTLARHAKQVHRPVQPCVKYGSAGDDGLDASSAALHREKGPRDGACRWMVLLVVWCALH